VGQAADHANRPGVYSASLPPRNLENREKGSYPETGEARQLQGQGVPGFSLMDVISKLVECPAANLIADHLERRKGIQAIA